MPRHSDKTPRCRFCGFELQWYEGRAGARICDGCDKEDRRQQQEIVDEEEEGEDRGGVEPKMAVQFAKR